MKAEELRIGNLVTDEWYESFPKIIKIDSIHKTGINIVASDDNKPYGMASPIIEAEYPFDELRPVTLTEEWLINFGFEKANDMDRWFRIRLLNDWSYLFVNPKHKMAEISINGHGCILKFDGMVHSLQNIWFSLNNEELILK